MFWRRRRHLEERIELLRLDLARVEGGSNLSNLLLATLVQQGHKTMAQLDDLISSLNANTNAVATRLDNLVAALAGATGAPTAAQLAQLSEIASHLKLMGQDASNPLPATSVVSIVGAVTSQPEAQPTSVHPATQTDPAPSTSDSSSTPTE